ncbi:MAG: ABC transporter permease subunit, partial [Fimbriimonas sp.]
MSLVGKVGRRRPRARIAMAMVYALLILGAVTTLYPFALMLSTGFKGPTDQNDNLLIPAYWQRDDELLKKATDDKYAGDLSAIESSRIRAEATPAVVKAYEEFLMALPPTEWMAGYRTGPNQVTGRLQVRYQAWLKTKYATIVDLNRAYIEENLAFQTATPPSELLERPGWQPVADAKWRDWLEFKATLPAEFRIPVRAQRLYQEFVRTMVQNRFESVPPEILGKATKFENLELPWGGRMIVGIPSGSHYGLPNPVESGILEEFRRVALPSWPQKPTVEAKWQEVLAKNGLRFDTLPIVAFEKQIVARDPGVVRREFAGRNFSYVLDYIALNGQALWNTALFCLLAIFTQLTVNPLAAYALSRYPIKASGQILIFLLATMAFPAEVAMIPAFLLLKDLGLLNTFAALVLPSAASGYMIFLLKGFFDSLPQELFEAGSLDGAEETTMMMRIAFPLSRPVLGYLALIAFMGAYSAFLYAFLVAQDQKMWTLMVWIYQLQIVAPKSVMMAALAVA